MTRDDIKLEIKHIFDSGANEVRVLEMVERHIRVAQRDIRHKAAEIAINPNYSNDEKHNKIMNLKCY